ncbi:MAG TPA: hypothetical protein VK641_00270, partial [Terriglobales bacterium]|nr:hypothetical protein [Terriglobales bacterium]
MNLRWICVSLVAITQLLPAQSKEAQPAVAAGAPGLAGYSSDNAAAQRNWEAKFRDGIAPDNIRENMRRLSARPHHVGSPYQKENAEWLLSKFKE